MHAEIVHHHNRSRHERRHENRFEIGGERIAIQRSFERHRCPQSRHRKRGNQRRDRVVIAWCAPVCPFAARCPAVARRHVRLRSALIEKGDVRRRPHCAHRPKRRPRRLIPLAGDQTLFFRVHPTRCCARHIVLWLTRTPVVASHRSQSVARVASGSASNCATKAASSARGMARGRPGRGCGMSEPVARHCLTYRLTLLRLTV